MEQKVLFRRDLGFVERSTGHSSCIFTCLIFPAQKWFENLSLSLSVDVYAHTCAQTQMHAHNFYKSLNYSSHVLFVYHKQGYTETKGKLHDTMFSIPVTTWRKASAPPFCLISVSVVLVFTLAFCLPAYLFPPHQPSFLIFKNYYHCSL